MTTLRRRLYVHLDTNAWTGGGLSPLNKAITVLILASIVTVVVETETSIHDPLTEAFLLVDLAFATTFLVEYLARLWVMGEDRRYEGLIGRVRYAMTPAAVIDLLAVLPYLLGIGGADSFLLRTLRLLRILTLAKLGRFSQALTYISSAIAERRHEIFISFAISGVVLFIAAIAMYLVEGPVQPETFGSIPRAMWWAVSNVTPVGAGNVYPITPFGKFLSGLIALAGIALIAMPAGMLAAAFSDALRRNREAPATGPSEET